MLKTSFEKLAILTCALMVLLGTESFAQDTAPKMKRLFIQATANEGQGTDVDYGHSGL